MHSLQLSQAQKRRQHNSGEILEKMDDHRDHQVAAPQIDEGKEKTHEADGDQPGRTLVAVAQRENECGEEDRPEGAFGYVSQAQNEVPTEDDFFRYGNHKHQEGSEQQFRDALGGQGRGQRRRGGRQPRPQQTPFEQAGPPG